MKSKEVKLSSEDKQKLLKLIAEEAKNLDDSNFSDEELEKEEKSLSQSIENILASSTESFTSAEDVSKNQKENWLKIKERIQAEAVEEPSEGSNVVSLAERKSNRLMKWSGGLAAAAALLFVIMINNQTPTEIDPAYSGFKGGEQGKVDCSYGFWDQMQGDLEGNGLVYRVQSGQNLNVKFSCSESGFVHLKLVEPEQMIQIVNMQPSDSGLLTRNGEVVELSIGSNSKVLLFYSSEKHTMSVSG